MMFGCQRPAFPRKTESEGPHIPLMKRRAFLSLTGAAACAPFLSSTAVATPLAASVPTSGHMALASHLARYNPQISAAGLMRVLKVPAGTAQQIMGQMTRQGIVTQASAGPVQDVVRHVADRVLKAEDALGDDADIEPRDDTSAEDMADTV